MRYLFQLARSFSNRGSSRINFCEIGEVPGGESYPITVFAETGEADNIQRQWEGVDLACCRVQVKKRGFCLLGSPEKDPFFIPVKYGFVLVKISCYFCRVVIGKIIEKEPVVLIKLGDGVGHRAAVQDTIPFRAPGDKGISGRVS